MNFYKHSRKDCVYWSYGKFDTVNFCSPDEETPAVIYTVDSSAGFHSRPKGTMVWCRDGYRHRTTGPAVIFPDGQVEYWLGNAQMSKSDWEFRRHNHPSLGLAEDKGREVSLDF